MREKEIKKVDGKGERRREEAIRGKGRRGEEIRKKERRG